MWGAINAIGNCSEYVYFLVHLGRCDGCHADVSFAPTFAVVPVGGPFFLHNVSVELRTSVVGDSADNRAAHAANNCTNRTSDYRAADCAAYGTGRGVVPSICREGSPTPQ